MASGSSRRTRADRVAGFTVGSDSWSAIWTKATRPDVLIRIALCLVAVVVLWTVTRGWSPPFAFRSGTIPPRDIISRVRFNTRDEERTRQRKLTASLATPAYYRHDPTPLRDVRLKLVSKLESLLGTDPVGQLPEELVQEFFPPESSAADDPYEKLSKLRGVIPGAEARRKLELAINQLLSEAERLGLLDNLEERESLIAGSPSSVRVVLAASPTTSEALEQAQTIPFKTVSLLKWRDALLSRFQEELQREGLPPEAVDLIAPPLADWLKPKLPVTLRFDDALTKEARSNAIAAVDAAPDETPYFPGQSRLVPGGHPIDAAELELLRKEHQAYVATRTWTERVGRSLTYFGLNAALCILCGLYINYLEPDLIADLRRFIILLAIVLLTVIACWLTAQDQWRAEIVPLLLFSMTSTIAYRRELALLLSTAVALLVTLILGHDLAQLIVTVATIASAIQLLGRIRSRTRLMYVGLAVSGVCLFMSLCVCGMAGEAHGAPQLLRIPLPDALEEQTSHYLTSLVAGALWTAICTLAASVFMTGLLPFIERLFDVQTGISLLELGDARHPLLQELVRRAPGTYNHSINVASIGEAAAEAIGANGLLVRVGAYFHDIGKMLKPQYFIENQGQEASKHQSLAPAMSTLVIIAHVKDGANLARQHHLPHSIIDFIEQHHGTTLVEYFFRQAAKQQQESDPDSPEIDEASFRYPGPKPQTRETGVMMLADAVESASRTLVDPTPARIENLVHELVMKRLLDGQFSDCGLTLAELHLIEQSLVKSLTAVYHGRVKYPEAPPE
ncbi:MAG: HD family phosphohydrolase [Planctomycetota bacterium]